MELADTGVRPARAETRLVVLPHEPTVERQQRAERAVPEAPRQGIRYERGRAVHASDGPVGTLKQVVIDEELAEVKALVVRMLMRNETVLVPPELVAKDSGHAILLNVTQAQFATGAGRSPRFDPRMFAAADRGRVSEAIPRLPRGDVRRSVVNLSRNHVETGDEVALTPGSARRGRHWWQIGGRRWRGHRA